MNNELKSRLQADLITARKAREKLRTLVLSTTLSDLRNREIELGGEASDEEVIRIVTKAIKRRKEAATQMRDGGRPELADKEALEADILSVYLPEGLSEDEVRAIVLDVVAGGADQFGAVMGMVMSRIGGRFDGKEANRLVREVLGQ